MAAHWPPIRSALFAALRTAARDAQRDGAQALVLGGAALAGLAGLVETDLPVIDAIDAATAALLIQLGLTHKLC